MVPLIFASDRRMGNGGQRGPQKQLNNQPGWKVGYLGWNIFENKQQSAKIEWGDKAKETEIVASVLAAKRGNKATTYQINNRIRHLMNVVDGMRRGIHQ